ncbi:MAG: 1-phosphofructokinase family hexose kinase [Bacteroidetes bacterium]|nr:1-phosphofructokinase family hexose kinase [Bacteroidota bacterium]
MNLNNISGHKIVTLTLSPCIDKNTAVPTFIPEKKLRCTQPQLEPGGGGINVARAIHHLGGVALAVFPSGGYTGKYFNHLLNQEQIPCCVIETENETRENITIFEESTGRQYRLCMPGTVLLETEWRQCIEKIQLLDTVEWLVASGSLPPGVPANIYAILAKIAREKNAKLVVDTSGAALLHAAAAGVYLLKPNRNELAALDGKKTLTEDEILPAARRVIKKGLCEVLLVSLGAEGALVVTPQMEQHILPPPVPVKSTVGAGDSMVAGMIHFLSSGKTIADAACYAVACGTAATMNAGTQLCSKQDADYLYHKIINVKKTGAG